MQAQDPCADWGDFEPTWSPNGSRIAASGWLFHGPPLYLVEFYVRFYDVNGGVLTNPRSISYGWSSRPAWSPDGDEIVFEDGRVVLAVSVAGQRRVVANLPCVPRDPAWSPDGAWIAFSCTDATEDIWIMNPQGQQMTRLTAADAASDRHPAWLPDGGSIAFTSNRAGNDDIWVVPLQGGEPTQLTQGPSNDTWPAWSPDGRFLAFTSDRGGSLDVWVLPIGRPDPVRITNDGSATGPAWSPNGAWIAYRSGLATCTDVVQVIPVPRIIAVERRSWSDVKQLYR